MMKLIRSTVDSPRLFPPFFGGKSLGLFFVCFESINLLTPQGFQKGLKLVREKI